MKLTLCTLSCPDWSLQQIIDACVANGIEGVDFRGLGPELDITRLSEFTTSRGQTLAMFARAGLQLPCLNTSLSLVTSDAGKWQEALDEWHRYATLAKAAGTPFLRVFGGNVPSELTRDEARQLARRHLRQLVKIARSFDCKPVLETHDAWIGSSQVMELIEGMSTDEVGVLWDIDNSYRAGEAITSTADALKRYICHAHVKDSVVVDGHLKPMLIGKGDSPIEESIRVLKSNGYDGWLSLEAEKRWDPATPDPEISVPQFARYFKNLLAT